MLKACAEGGRRALLTEGGRFLTGYIWERGRNDKSWAFFHVEYGEPILKEKYLIHFCQTDWLLITWARPLLCRRTFCNVSIFWEVLQQTTAFPESLTGYPSEHREDPGSDLEFGGHRPLPAIPFNLISHSLIDHFSSVWRNSFCLVVWVCWQDTSLRMSLFHFFLKDIFAEYRILDWRFIFQNYNNVVSLSSVFCGQCWEVGSHFCCHPLNNTPLTPHTLTAFEILFIFGIQQLDYNMPRYGFPLTYPTVVHWTSWICRLMSFMISRNSNL